MELKYKLFPYPVLWNVLDNYKTTHFTSKINIEQSIKHIKISCEFDMDNMDIDERIKNGEAEYLVHIECPLTAYRDILCTSQKHIDCVINESDLNGRVSVCTFIVAKTDIRSYRNYDFNDDYAGVSFRIERGAILAIGNQTQIKIDKNTDELASIPSIFSVVKKETTDRIGMQVEMESDKIRICLNIKDFADYQLISKMPAISDTMHSALILPALIYIFEQIKTSLDDYEDYRWFKSIRAVFKKYNIIFNEDLLQSKTSLELSQILLDMPTERAFSSLIGISNLEEEEI